MMASKLVVDKKVLVKMGEKMASPDTPIPEKMRLCFTLKNIGGNDAIDTLLNGFKDPSVLLRHEIAYVLGQMQNEYAIPMLSKLLENKDEDTMVRHEAGEALGAIGAESVLPLLDHYCSDDSTDVAETCQLAAALIRWRKERKADDAAVDNKGKVYSSVDPAPPSAGNKPVEELEDILLNEKLPLFDRYRAMFALRDIGTSEAVLALAKGFHAKSALMRHEIAYVFGQMQHPASVSSLKVVLQNSSENDMVRHEAAEALGSIGTEDCLPCLQAFEKDQADVVRESCVVALDITDYNASGDFQYANGLLA